MASPAREAGARGSDSGTAETLPRRFGRYTLFDRIGRGGMADIYLAQVKTEIGTPRRVVIKEILPELSRNPRFAKMLVDEAKLVAGLSHANIAGVMDLGREGERLFIAMEYVEGFDLNQLLRRLSKGRIALPADFALFVVREILTGLDFAHRKRDDEGEPLGIVHRDVSPSNVLISFEGEVKLCDFGIARAFSSDVASPTSGRDSGEDTGERSKVAGKAAYMSPEHARGDDVDGRSDVFSAGIILWELCAGRRLYKGTEDRMLELARAAEIPPLPEGRLPEQATLQQILDRALARDPAGRYGRAGEMLRALDDYAMGAKLFASQLRFGSFLSDHFEEEVVLERRERERAVARLSEAPGAVSDGGTSPAAEQTPDPAPDLSPSVSARADDTLRVPTDHVAHPGITDDIHQADTVVKPLSPDYSASPPTQSNRVEPREETRTVPAAQGSSALMWGLVVLIVLAAVAVALLLIVL